MKFLLVIIIIQHGVRETFKDTYNTQKECKIARVEALKHNNSVTKVVATCMRI